ncbi:MAG TPA: HAD-IA family hydrolase [Acidimicrobiales bacterium]|nr:HAD-IA family hydrolase [Acidimicrobiales bacterium]
MTVLPCTGVLFDCDGVLVDSHASVASAWQRWALDLGLDPEEVRHLAHGRRSEDTVALFVPEDHRGEQLDRINRYELEDVTSVQAVNGTVPLLQGMPPEKWAVVTSGRAELAHARLRAAGLPVPRVLVSAEDVVFGKPDPEGYLSAAHRLGIAAAEAVVLEDAAPGIEAAKAAGVASVIGVGERVAGEGADIVVADLSCIRWTGEGLKVSPWLF